MTHIELKADGAYIDGERVERELTATIARDCSLKPDNSIDGITCESLLADIERAAAEPGVWLDGTTKALWVILRRLVAMPALTVRHPDRDPMSNLA